MEQWENVNCDIDTEPEEERHILCRFKVQPNRSLAIKVHDPLRRVTPTFFFLLIKYSNLLDPHDGPK